MEWQSEQNFEQYLPRGRVSGLAYLGRVEILYGYPLDAVVLTTGCDKTTPSAIMAAATVDIPAIVLSGGPMLDGYFEDELVGSGTVVWKSRRRLAAGQIDEEQFFEAALASAPSAGHCNTIGTASTMNAVAEVLGLSLPGSAMIPAPYRERGQVAYATGKRIVEMAYEDLRPSKILTRDAFLNAIVAVTALGGSTNAQPHIMAMASHAGAEIEPADWAHGYEVPMLVNMQPAGEYLGERFHRAGGVPAMLNELLGAGRLNGEVQTATGRTLAENVAGRQSTDREMITPYDAPLQEHAGSLVLSGNLFDFAIIKTSVISDEFRERYLSEPGREGVFEGHAVVFDGSDDYHQRINDPGLGIDERTVLVIRGAGPLGWPGSAEVVNMQPPDALLQRGINALPTIGDGRQSGTSDSASILHAAPESAAGGGLAWLRTGDVSPHRPQRWEVRHAGVRRRDRTSQERGGRPARTGEPHALARTLPRLGGAARRRRGLGSGAEVPRHRVENAAPQPLIGNFVLGAEMSTRSA